MITFFCSFVQSQQNLCKEEEKKISHLIHCTYGPIYTDASYANKQTKKQKTKTQKSTKLKNGLDLRKYKFFLSKATVIN